MNIIYSIIIKLFIGLRRRNERTKTKPVVTVQPELPQWPQTMLMCIYNNITIEFKLTKLGGRKSNTTCRKTVDSN